MVLTFVTGPVRSGKSRFAERLALATGFAVTYVVTGPLDDGDAAGREREAQRAARRPASWHVVETGRPEAPSLEAVLSLAGEREALIIDTIPAWLAQRAGAHEPSALEAHAETLLAAIASTRAHAIVVGEEVGWGVAPLDPAGRALRDVAGKVQARLATSAERSYLVVSGFALDLRTQGRPIER